MYLDIRFTSFYVRMINFYVLSKTNYKLWFINYQCFVESETDNKHYVQLKFGNGEDFNPRNGRWNFNQKVYLIQLLFYICSS